MLGLPPLYLLSSPDAFRWVIVLARYMEGAGYSALYTWQHCLHRSNHYEALKWMALTAGNWPFYHPAGYIEHGNHTAGALDWLSGLGRI